jgi:hypothetical protein
MYVKIELQIDIMLSYGHNFTDMNSTINNNSNIDSNNNIDFIKKIFI